MIIRGVDVADLSRYDDALTASVAALEIPGRYLLVLEDGAFLIVDSPIPPASPGRIVVSADGVEIISLARDDERYELATLWLHSISINVEAMAQIAEILAGSVSSGTDPEEGKEVG